MHRFTDTSDGDLCVDLPLGEVEPRRRRIVDEPWTWLRLEHGAGVVTVRGPGEHAGATADAAVTATPGCPVSVTTADCAPVLFEAPGAVGVAHAGWRGLLAGVLEATVDAMEAIGHPPHHAALGPCIGAHHYEFGVEDLDRAADRYGRTVRATTTEGRPALDLTAGVAAACASRGLVLRVDGRCTACSPDHWSYRARGDRARQALVAWVPR